MVTMTSFVQLKPRQHAEAFGETCHDAVSDNVQEALWIVLTLQ